MTIRKVRNKQLYRLKSKTTGRILGTFRSRKKAKARERQIKAIAYYKKNRGK